MSVADGALSDHGVLGLSIADAGDMPGVTHNSVVSTVVMREFMADILCPNAAA